MESLKHTRIPVQSLKVVLAIASVFLAENAMAQTSFPQITHMYPAALQRGATSEVTLSCESSNPGNAIAILFEGKGIKAEPLTSAKANELKMKVQVDKEATVGFREFRIAANSGASTVGQVLITDQPVLAEQTAPHADFSAAQKIDVNSVVSGMLSAKEQVDAYKFKAEAGQTISFAVVSHRFFYKRHSQFTPIDPIVTIHDSSGRELAANDDFHFADPSVSYKFNSPGEYMVVVRDVDFASSTVMPYNLIVTGGPYVNWAFPLVFATKGPFQATLGGANLPENALPLLGLAEQAKPEITVFAQVKTSLGLSNAFPVHLTDLPILDSATATRGLAIPCVVNSRILKNGQTQEFPITLKKGDAIRLEVRARRLGSELDSFLAVADEKGKVLASNDDLANTTKDSQLIFTAPADGNFKVQVRDLLNRGGNGFNYALVATKESPDFTVTCDDDKAGIPPGMNAAWYVRVKRNSGFTGPVTFKSENLPAGVNQVPLTLPATVNDGCLIFQCAGDSKPNAGLVNIYAEGTYKDASGKDVNIRKRVEPLTELKMPGGGRSTWPVETQIVAVTPDRDLTVVKVKPEKIELTPGKTMEIEIEIARNENYKGRVSLDVIHRHLGAIFGNPLPPGVTVVDAGAKTALTEKETKGKIILKAAPDAKSCAPVPVCVLANVSLNFTVKRGYASNPVSISVVEK